MSLPNSRGQGAGGWPPVPPLRRRPQPGGLPRNNRERTAQPDQFGSLRASLLYCPTCRQATPARERLLLILPTGDLYEYLCVECGTSTGSKTARERGGAGLLLP
jgi:hypothetical protein